MADRAVVDNKTNEFVELPNVAGKVWMFQNRGIDNIAVVHIVDDGQAPERNEGEVIEPYKWSVQPVSIDANERVYFSGNTSIFLREVISA